MSTPANQRYCHFEKCELGYAYLKDLPCIVPYKATPQNVKENKVCLSTVNIVPFILRRGYRKKSVLSAYLQGNYANTDRFFSIPSNDKNVYYGFTFFVIDKTVTCSGLDVYSDYGDYYVNALMYGVEVSVMTLRDNFPGHVDDMKVLMNNAMAEPDVLTDEQKREKCRVLINNSVIKEMTLEEVFKFKKAYLNGQHQEYMKLTYVGCATQKNMYNFNIRNKDEVISFLNRLYLFYITVERKLADNGYPIHDYCKSENKYKSLKEKMTDSIKNYESFKSKNLIELYPIVKDLYWSHAEYIRYCIEHRITIDLKLPNVVKIKNYYKKINIEPSQSFDSNAGSQKACPSCGQKTQLNPESLLHVCGCGEKTSPSCFEFLSIRLKTFLSIFKKKASPVNKDINDKK